METYKYLLDLAIILLCTKALGLATRKVQMPQVVGALLAGVLLGPAMLGILTETSFIHNVAEIGVIVLMFCAGLETDIQELKASGKASAHMASVRRSLEQSWYSTGQTVTSLARRIHMLSIRTATITSLKLPASCPQTLCHSR